MPGMEPKTIRSPAGRELEDSAVRCRTLSSSVARTYALPAMLMASPPKKNLAALPTVLDVVTQIKF